MTRMVDSVTRPWVPAVAWLVILSVRHHWRWSDHVEWLAPTRCNVDDLCTAPEAGTHRAVALALIGALSLVLVGLSVLRVVRSSSARPEGNEAHSRRGSIVVTAGLVLGLCVVVSVLACFFAFVVALGGDLPLAGVPLLGATLVLARLLGEVLEAGWKRSPRRRSAGWGFVVAVLAVVGSAASSVVTPL